MFFEGHNALLIGCGKSRSTRIFVKATTAREIRLCPLKMSENRKLQLPIILPKFCCWMSLFVNNNDVGRGYPELSLKVSLLEKDVNEYPDIIIVK